MPRYTDSVVEKRNQARRTPSFTAEDVIPSTPVLPPSLDMPHSSALLGRWVQQSVEVEKLDAALKVCALCALCRA